MLHVNSAVDTAGLCGGTQCSWLWTGGKFREGGVCGLHTEGPVLAGLGRPQLQQGCFSTDPDVSPLVQSSDFCLFIGSSILSDPKSFGFFVSVPQGTVASCSAWVVTRAFWQASCPGRWTSAGCPSLLCFQTVSDKCMENSFI